MAYITKFSFVNEVSIGIHPTANAGEDFDNSSGIEPSALGPYIEKVIPVAAGATHEISYDRFGRFPIIVCSLITPTIIHRHARFPWLGRCLNVLFRSGEILRYSGAVVDENVRLKLANHPIHLYGFPAICGERPRNVVPKNVKLSVIGAESRT